MGSPGPGWYDDGHGAIRWWDGNAWTEATQDATTPEPKTKNARLEKAGLRTDIAAAAANMASTFGYKTLLKDLPRVLSENEVVELLDTCKHLDKGGILALTNERLIFYEDFTTSLIGRRNHRDFPLSNISSIQYTDGLLSGSITVFGFGDKAEFTNIQQGVGKAMVDLVRSQIGRQNIPVPTVVQVTPTAAVEPSLSDKIHELSSLALNGVITDEEYQAAKAKLLGI